MEIRIAGIDPSMRNTGLAFGTYNLGDGTYNVGTIGLIQTFPSKEKKVRKSSLDYEACREMYMTMHSYLRQYSPQIVFAEMPTGSQSASGMKSYGISLMLLGTITVPVIQLSPQEVKVAAVDSKTASKQTMMNWAARKWPNLQWLTRKVDGNSFMVNKNEHMADACAAIEAGLKTNQWKQLLSIMSLQEVKQARADEESYL